MRRHICTFIAASCLLSAAVSAQTGLRSASLPDRTPTNPVPPAQTLPSASLPDRTATNPIPPPRADQFLAGPDTYTNARHRGPRRHRQFTGYGYAPYAYPFAVADPDDRVDQEADGFLHLDMQPGTADVHVDGFYMGTVDDFRRLIPGRSLAPGEHRVEVRAPGHESATFDILIAPKQTVTYRRDLQPTPAPPSATARTTPQMHASPQPKTFYIIPGCYAGDRPPRTRLPRGCDVSKLRKVPPVVATMARR